MSRKKEQACRQCHSITTENECPICHSNELTTDYLGYVIISQVDKSLIAEKMEIDTPGKYALKVR